MPMYWSTCGMERRGRDRRGNLAAPGRRARDVGHHVERVTSLPGTFRARPRRLTGRRTATRPLGWTDGSVTNDVPALLTVRAHGKAPPCGGRGP
jgi:hypothetical protein